MLNFLKVKASAHVCGHRSAPVYGQGLTGDEGSPLEGRMVAATSRGVPGLPRGAAP